MRFVIREQEYETLLAAGLLSYRSAGAETGAVERWRLTQAVDGYGVMRIDLDRRDTVEDSSTLLHLLLNPDGRPERLKLRRFSAQQSPIDVDVLIDAGSLSMSRNCDGEIRQDEMSLPPGFALLMPATIGLAMFVHGNQGRRSATAIALDENRSFAPLRAEVEINQGDEEEIVVTGQTATVRPYLIRRNGVENTIWLDDYGLPVRFDDEDGTKAVEVRYVRRL
jgi:hypothetical protein